MAEDEQTVEVPAETPHSGDSTSATTVDSATTERTEFESPTSPTKGESEADDAISRFHELDEDFERPPGGSSDEPRRAVVTDAKHVEAGEVPETYPLEGDPSTAIALTLDFGMETATAYLAWPTGDSETGLSRLLDTLDIELPNLYGETVFVERQGVHAVVVTPEETPRGSDRRAEILGGVGIITGCIGILATVPSVETIAWPLFVLMTIGIFPYFVYTDARYVKTHSDWDGVPSVWATLSALPFYNLGIVGAYLWRRSRAQFFSEQRSLRGSIAAKVRSLL